MDDRCFILELNGSFHTLLEKHLIAIYFAIKFFDCQRDTDPLKRRVAELRNEWTTYLGEEVQSRWVLFETNQINDHVSILRIVLSHCVQWSNWTVCIACTSEKISAKSQCMLPIKTKQMILLPDMWSMKSVKLSIQMFS